MLGPLAQGLKGKGRPKSRETVFLPPRPAKEREDAIAKFLYIHPTLH